MKRNVGLWIDHRQAVVVFSADGDEEVKRIKSNMERHTRPSGGSRSRTPYGPQDVLAEDNRERRFAARLGKYYDQVISSVRDAQSILIFGPGEAKIELKKRMARRGMGTRIIATETADKMTGPQIAERVRRFFLKQQ